MGNAPNHGRGHKRSQSVEAPVNNPHVNPHVNTQQPAAMSLTRSPPPAQHKPPPAPKNEDPPVASPQLDSSVHHSTTHQSSSTSILSAPVELPEEKPYRCPKCERTFANHFNSRRHFFCLNKEQRKTLKRLAEEAEEQRKMQPPLY